MNIVNQLNNAMPNTPQIANQIRPEQNNSISSTETLSALNGNNQVTISPKGSITSKIEALYNEIDAIYMSKITSPRDNIWRKIIRNLMILWP